MSKREQKRTLGPRKQNVGVSELMYSTIILAPSATGTLPGWKTLNATPVEVVGKPGDGKAILFERAIIEMSGGGTDGDTDSNLSFRYKGGTGDDQSQAQDDLVNDCSASGTIMTVERIGTEAEPQTLGFLQENLALELYAASSLAASAGDRNMTVTVLYRIVDVHY